LIAFLESIRAVSWRLVVLALTMSVAFSLAWSAVPLPRDTTNAGAQTARLVWATLVNWGELLFIVGGFMFRLGRLRPADVGWRLPALGVGILVTVGFWIAMQPALALYMLANGQELRWNDAWSHPGPGYLLGALGSQLVGNALLEETLFRAFLLPQFYLMASRFCRKSVALTVALLSSQLLFTLMHLPVQILSRDLPADQVLEAQIENLILGLALCAVYLATRNLFVAVGLHALWNQPARLLPVPFEPGVKLVWFSLTAILLVGWLSARTWRNRSGSHRPESEVCARPQLPDAGHRNSSRGVL